MKRPQSLPLQALINAVAGFLYVLLIAWSMFRIGDLMPEEDTFLAPTTFLLLFVVSAAIEASLILGQPIMLFLDGKKSEAVRLLAMTIGWLFVITVMIIAVQIIR